ncbi:MAG: amidophosphoribosyltransferase [Firmicutes bacterium]|nr:amidophosphoribosyltransferase [Bacillota bacterium]
MPDALVCSKLNEACGVCGGFAAGQPLAYLTGLALYALQHRGQESAGIVAGDGRGGRLWHRRGLGLVSEVFPRTNDLKEIPCRIAVGHVRYPYQQEEGCLGSSQPVVLRYRYGELAIGHNGRLINGPGLRAELEAEGAIFQTRTDSELLAHLVARQGAPDLEEALAAVVPRLKGGFSFIVTDGRRVIGLRDGYGLRPLSLATLKGGGYYLASETCAFDSIGAKFLRDVKPGEMILLDSTGIRSRQLVQRDRSAFCVFEYIYFARPDSNLLGKNVHLVRRELGRRLAREQPVEADLVSGVPDSSISAASGYAEESGLPNEMALVKNRYIGRVFITPTREMREQGADIKLNAVEKIVRDKRVVLIDDSIVRGTTSLKLVQLMLRAGAKEVHLRISAPPVIASCYYGIDMPADEELILFNRTADQVARYTGADSVAFLSMAGVAAAVGLPEDRLCWSCFNGDYPAGRPDQGGADRHTNSSDR